MQTPYDDTNTLAHWGERERETHILCYFNPKVNKPILIHVRSVWCVYVFIFDKVHIYRQVLIHSTEKFNVLLTGNKVQLYFTEMNSRYFILRRGEKNNNSMVRLGQRNFSPVNTFFYYYFVFMIFLKLSSFKIS